MYCVNTGYTVFKLVEVIDGNNEYYILKQSLSHGVSIYDRIILDADKYSENEMIYLMLIHIRLMTFRRHYVKG